MLYPIKLFKNYFAQALNKFPKNGGIEININ